jgi:hypothetical protein
MILSHKHKFIFISNGKTGTTSIQAALAPLQEAEHLDLGIPGLFSKGHIPPALLKSFVGRRVWETYYKFCFVRNPWDWMVSQFFYNFVRESRRKVRTTAGAPEGEAAAAPDAPDEIPNVGALTPDDVRKTYELLKNHKGLPDADSLFQYHYAFDEGGRPMVDYVGRFETLREDYEQIMKTVGASAELPFRNVTLHRPYASYYDDETRDLVAKLYEIDVRAFGYAFDAGAA